MNIAETLNAINTRMVEINSGLAKLDNEIALEAPELFPYWKADRHYEKETSDQLIRVRDPENGFLYSLIPNVHDSQETWPPRLVPAIWRRVDEPGEEWPEWRQPLSAEDAYDIDAKVSHNFQHWISTIQGNVWEPGVYGWEVSE